MTLKIVVVSILALASMAAAYYLLKNGLVPDAAKQSNPGKKVQEADQGNKAKEAEEHREAELLLQCLALAEAEYVSDLDREYNNARARATFSRHGRYDINPEIQHRIESRKETSANNCQKEYGQPPASSP